MSSTSPPESDHRSAPLQRLLDAQERDFRREALDAAVRSQRGPETGPELVAKAESLLAFLRGDAPSREAQEDVAYRAAGR